MNIINVAFDYKKCFKCGYITDKMHESSCKCGGFLYVCGGYYVPKVKPKSKTK